MANGNARGPYNTPRSELAVILANFQAYQISECNGPAYGIRSNQLKSSVRAESCTSFDSHRSRSPWLVELGVLRPHAAEGDQAGVDGQRR